MVDILKRAGRVGATLYGGRARTRQADTGPLGVAEWRLADGFAKTLGQVAGRRLTYDELTGNHS